MTALAWFSVVLAYVVCGATTAEVVVYRYARDAGRHGESPDVDHGDLIALVALSFAFWWFVVGVICPVIGAGHAFRALYQRGVLPLVERGYRAGEAERDAERQREIDARDADAYEAKLRADAEAEAARLLAPEPSPDPEAELQGALAVQDAPTGGIPLAKSSDVTTGKIPIAPPGIDVSMLDLYDRAKEYLTLEDSTQIIEACRVENRGLVRAICLTALDRQIARSRVVQRTEYTFDPTPEFRNGKLSYASTATVRRLGDLTMDDHVITSSAGVLCEHEATLVCEPGVRDPHYRCRRCGALWPERIGPRGPVTW